MGPVWPLPKTLAIVWCKFPYLGEPAPRHPCLILEAGRSNTNGDIFVVVAGGTSANKSGDWARPIQDSDLVLQTPNQIQKAGLTTETAFQFVGVRIDVDGKMSGGTLLTLPYSTEFFVCVKPAITPVVGCLDMSDARTRESLITVGKRTNLKRLLAEERTRYSASPDTSTILKER